MILAGIDEAGLGPALGPLCVASSALRVPDDWRAHKPWSALKKIVAREVERGDARMLIADSKVVYTARQFAGLERGVLAFLTASASDGKAPADRNALLERLQAHAAIEALARVPWFAGAPWPLPRENGPESVEQDAEALAKALTKAKAEVVCLRAILLPAKSLNERFAVGLNKHEALLEQTGAHLRYLAETFLNDEVTVTVDKQGGRNSYLPWLCNLFPGAWIDTLAEGAALSEYILRREGPVLRVAFLPKADGEAFCVSLASMIAKYLRECFMEDLNAFFRRHRPELKKTAGYHGDASRFLDEIDSLLQELKITRDDLVRMR